ncbi:hypothetical protein SAMN05421774_104167 [Gemmobacter megaterium]|uniref:Cell division protein FtsL n=1 Tax=Gemmobacter megaterium TaxID=1086013 RepID=A0A1N7NVP7_9RHOB|nr:hypothetical protein [Gemmobacter megaterium]GGE16337.1 cell division protein FtsL [Gemmobacter megaterium]SIT02368.1 hypothetical protein SAMN05421774_104167 [Gemmobacter megaterium]
MRSALVILSFLAMLASGFWAYRENYATKVALREAQRLGADIGRLQEAIAVQRAEWAYLNRPDRLAELASANFDRLGLLSMLPEQFAETRQLPEPAADPLANGLDGVAIVSAEDEDLLP